LGKGSAPTVPGVPLIRGAMTRPFVV